MLTFIKWNLPRIGKNLWDFMRDPIISGAPEIEKFVEFEEQEILDGENDQYVDVKHEENL
jgi:hypothetical protein